MHTQETERERQAGLGPAAKHVAEHASALVRLELELAALEVKRKVVSLAKGIVFGLGALLFLLFALGRIKKGTPPVPEQAIREAKLTTEALKSDGHG